MSIPGSNWLGIDFGTSNSAVSILRNGDIQHIEMENGQSTLPTSVFFDFIDKEMKIGTSANQALVNGTTGRYMRALKSVLGTSLMSEKRNILGENLDFYDIISRFIGELKHRAELAMGENFDNVVAGRPVYFHSENAEKDAKALDDLKTCFLRAGFKTIEFLMEPEAAALANRDGLNDNSLGLVVDIGGGTSDFTLFKKANRGIEVIASNGIRLGGTDFDRALNFNFFMPHFGKGSPLRRPMGEGNITTPNYLYSDLATWEKIPFLYDPKTLLAVNEMQRDAIFPELFDRLKVILEERLGHELAFCAEAAKIKGNTSDAAWHVDLSLVEQGLGFDMNKAYFDTLMSGFQSEISQAINQTLVISSIEADQISDVILVGGSGLMGFVKHAIHETVPNAKFHQGAIFTAIVDGLALRTEQLIN